ncbi:hypothetical protein FD755_021759, partial [Muntiacus reevesi]
ILSTSHCPLQGWQIFLGESHKIRPSCTLIMKMDLYLSQFRIYPEGKLNFLQKESFSYVFPCSRCRCYNCGGLDHHAKECSLPPQPKKCHCCQSITHMVANCPHKTAGPPPAGSQGRREAEPQPSAPAAPREAGGGPGGASSPEARAEPAERPARSPPDASSTRASAAAEEQSKKGPSVQKRKKT